MKTAEHVRPLIGLRWFTTVLYWIRGEYIYIYISVVVNFGVLLPRNMTAGVKTQTRF